MPHFVYDGDDEREFPHLGLTLKPGETVERDANPDPVFFQPVEQPVTAPGAEHEDVD